MFINKKLRSSGISPSYEEMKQSLNLKSKSGIHRLITALEERGFIRKLAHKARALEVIKLPETASANDIYNSFSPSVIKGGLDEDKKNNDGKEKKEQQQPQQGKGQLSPQQIQNLLETMANQEAKVQEKLNAKKAKAAKVKTEKDW